MDHLPNRLVVARLMLLDVFFTQTFMTNDQSLEYGGFSSELACLRQEQFSFVGSSSLLHMSTDGLEQHGPFLKATLHLPDQFPNGFHDPFQ